MRLGSAWSAPGLHAEQCGQAVGSGGEHFSPGLRPLPSFWGRGTAESLRMHKGSPPGLPLTREREPPRALCRRLQGPGPRGARRGCTTGPTLARAGHGTGTSPTHRGAGHSCPGVIVLPGPGPPELPLRLFSTLLEPARGAGWDGGVGGGIVPTLHTDDAPPRASGG